MYNTTSGPHWLTASPASPGEGASPRRASRGPTVASESPGDVSRPRIPTSDWAAVAAKADAG